jgi:hypothetical protein
LPEVAIFGVIKEKSICASDSLSKVNARVYPVSGLKRSLIALVAEDSEMGS